MEREDKTEKKPCQSHKLNGVSARDNKSLITKKRSSSKKWTGDIMLCWAEWQTLFYKKASTDNRASLTPFTLNFALLNEAGNMLAIPLYVRRSILMKKAKIYCPVTLNQCLKELHAYRNINYWSSF